MAVQPPGVVAAPLWSGTLIPVGILHVEGGVPLPLPRPAHTASAGNNMATPTDTAGEFMATHTGKLTGKQKDGPRSLPGSERQGQCTTVLHPFEHVMSGLL